jgi:hypothetical protein
MRKTVKIKDLINKTNNCLAEGKNCDPEAVAFRMGMCLMLESILMEADVYIGFSYLESAGVEKDHNGYCCHIADESRRNYGIDPKLEI